MTIYTVNSVAELNATLSKSVNGDVIQLASGNYGKVFVSGINIPGNVIITSADPQNKAVLSGLLLQNSSGLTLSNLDLTSTVVGVQNPFQVASSQNIVLDHLTVQGPNNVGSGLESQLVMIRNSTNVTVSNSEFFNGWHALNLLDNKGLTVANNYIHDIRTDGIRGGGNSDLVITKNTFTDFRPAVGDHPDAIQLWTINTTASASNIAITDNLIVRGQGSQMQGIFIGDNGNLLPFQNVTITGNMVTGGLYNGISLNGAVGGTISDNIVAGYADQRSWILAANVTGVSVANNASTFWPLSMSAWSSSFGNTTIPSVTDMGSALVTQWLSTHTAVSSGWGVSDSAFLGSVLAGTSISGAAIPPPPAPTPAPTPTDTTTPTTPTTTDGTTAPSSGGTTSTTPTVLPGGSGNDTYTVRSVNDLVVETANGGTDTVRSYIDYTLGANVENLWLEATGLTGTGNALANRIVGSGGTDTIYGMDGNDTLQGRGGDDLIYGGNGNDTLWGDDGNDRLFGDAGNDILYGGNGNDILNGGAGNDRLEGGSGNDILTGGAGKDVFLFRTDDFASPTNVEITDFTRGQDKIGLNLVQLSNGGDFRFIGTAQFHNVVGELRYQVQNGSAIVQGDINGDGKADFTITLDKVTKLAGSDFLL